MKKLLILLVFVSVFAQEATHAVKDGDTLWDIAGFYYQNPFLWPYIWRANLTKIADPHWIYPEQLFVIPPSPEEAISEIPEEVPVYVPEEEVTMIPPEEPTTEVFSVIEPERRVFSEQLIHRAGFILEQDMPYWGKIVGVEQSYEKALSAYQVVYVDRAENVNVDDQLTIYRPGKVITHPKTGKRLGKEVIVLGKAVVEAVGEEGSRCKIMASYDIIKKGDFVTPYEPVLAPDKVELIPTEKEIEGYVVEVKTGQKLTPPHVFAYIDQGEDTGIAVGDVFDIYQERIVAGKKMPDIDIGHVQVISVFSEVSIGLILASREPLAIRRGERCRLVSEAR
ncbi:MAG: LysM peptidoglycan-binding domain-containing protein [candidate division WOR-3 bacterium]|nr:MAG: LysM peptidoglycan-binding domain-containing protein [candidate division WOR-3 bacterium]